MLGRRPRAPRAGTIATPARLSNGASGPREVAGAAPPSRTPPQAGEGSEDHTPAPAVQSDPRIPLGWALLALAVTFNAAALVTRWPQIGAGLLALGASVVVGTLAYRHGGALVSVVALLVFWLPFNTTFTRFGIGPQEIAVYAILLLIVILDPRPIRRSLAVLVASFSPVARYALLVFGIACAVAALLAFRVDRVTGINSFRAYFLFPVATGALVAYTARRHRCLRLLAQVFVAGAAALAMYALTLRFLGVQFVDGAVAGRIGSEASFIIQYRPNGLGLYFVFGLALLPPVLGDALKSRTAPSFKFAAGVWAGTIMLIALWLTYSRGALVALALAAGTYVLIGLAQARPHTRLVGAAVAAVAGLLAVLGLWKGRSLIGRYGTLLSLHGLAGDSSVKFRLALYGRALHQIAAHPLFGSGFAAFAQSSAVPFSPHDTYLDLAVSAGPIAVAGFVLAVIWGLRAAVRVSSASRRIPGAPSALYGAGIVAALVAFLSQGFVESFGSVPMIAPALWLLVGLAEGTLLAIAARQPTREEAPSAALAAGMTDAAVDPTDSGAFEWPEDTGDIPDEVTAEEEDEWLAQLSGTMLGGLSVERALDSGVLPALGVEDLARRSGIYMRMPAPALQSPPEPLAEPSAPAASASASVVAAPTTSGELTALTETGRMRVVSRQLLQRAPASYVWNQLYSLWYFFTTFVLSVIVARGLSRQDFGVYSVLTTVLTTALFISALGLEDVASIFVARVYSRYGTGAAGRLIWRLLWTRIAIAGAIGAVFAALLPFALPMLRASGVTAQLTDALSGQQVWVRTGLMGVYLLGNGAFNLENVLFASLLRSRVTFVVGGLAQALTVVATWLLLRQGFNVDGVIGANGVISCVAAVAYFFALWPVLRRSGAARDIELPRTRGFQTTAWLTNVTNSFLGKQLDIALMAVFAVSFAAIGYYNLAYTLANIIGLLLIAGLGGVSPAAMSAALAAGGRERLAQVWRSVVMLQVILTIPAIAWALVSADKIAIVLYGQQYAGAIPLLRLFLAFTFVGRLVGGGVHQSALYVVGRQRAVLVNRWIGLIANTALDVLLIPRFGPMGALMGTGTTQLLVGSVEHLLVRRYIPVRYPAGFALRVLLCSAVGAGLAALNHAPGALGLGLSIACFVVGFVPVLLLLLARDPSELQSVLDASPRLRQLVVRIWPAWRTRSAESAGGRR